MGGFCRSGVSLILGSLLASSLSYTATVLGGGPVQSEEVVSFASCPLAFTTNNVEGLITVPASEINGKADIVLHVKRENKSMRAEEEIQSLITVNDRRMAPEIRMKMGQKLIVEVENNLDEVTTLHSHGVFFPEGYAWYDGAHMTTECGIPPGSKQKYIVYGGPTQSGTFWYHSHKKGQYLDGFRGPLIIEGGKLAGVNAVGSDTTNGPYKYVDEFVAVVTEWYLQPYEKLFKEFLHHHNPDGIEPIPDFPIINGQTELNNAFQCVTGEKVLLRIINASGLASFVVFVDDHEELEIVEVDGVYVKPYTTYGVGVSAAQRTSVLINCNKSEEYTYKIHFVYDLDLFDATPALPHEVVATFTYNGYNNPVEFVPGNIDYYISEITERLIEEIDSNLHTPLDEVALYNPTKRIRLDVEFLNLDDTANHGTFNNISFAHAEVPSLFTMYTLGSHADKKEAYGSYTNSYVFEEGDVIQALIVNNDLGNHPFHIHGHNFQIAKLSAKAYEEGDEEVDLEEIPERRDTVMIKAGGYAVIRFIANNPGVWVFHCHIQWHLDSGLGMQFVVLPKEAAAGQLARLFTLPPKHLRDNCESLGIKYCGNAVGREGLDLRGEKVHPKVLPYLHYTEWGASGVFFDILAFVVGLGTLTWYGFSKI